MVRKLNEGNKYKQWGKSKSSAGNIMHTRSL